MANVGIKNKERAEVPFVNIAVPVEDREKLRILPIKRAELWLDKCPE